MTVKLSPLPFSAVSAATTTRRARAFLRQTLMVVLINIPTMSFGLAMGWVSLASGASVSTEEPTDGADSDTHVVVAAAVTFVASLVGVPLSARALAAGRKPALIATSAMFVACWTLKLCGGGWWLVAARACAGLGGAGAWTLSPLLAREMCSASVRGAAVSALVLANNVGVLLMYLAADLQLQHQTVLWSCLCLSAVHCVVFSFMPESPQYLAAQGRTEEARTSLAWLRGVSRDEPELSAELAEFPVKQRQVSAVKLITNMLSEAGRRRAFVLSCVLVVGQEACGVLALMQFAERVFELAAGDEGGGGVAPARFALMLGVAQLLASALALYLVERVGRKRLIVWCGAVTGLSLGVSAGAVRWAGGGAWAALALAAAVFADSAGLQPAPYAMMADMFDYEYRSCVVSLVGALAWLGNALEVVLFPAVAARAGLSAALALSAALTLALAFYARCSLPETRGRSPRDIYALLLRRAPPPPCDVTVATKM